MACDNAIRADGPVATPLEEARRNIGRDILAGESGASALARYAAHVDTRLRRLYEEAEAGPSGRSAAPTAIGRYGPPPPWPFSDLHLPSAFPGPVENPAGRV